MEEIPRSFELLIVEPFVFSICRCAGRDKMAHSVSSREFSADISSEGDALDNMSIAVISTSDLAQSMKEALLGYHKSQREPYKLYVHVSEEMKEELCDRTVHIDYFIILADPRTDAAEKVKDNLLHLSPVFLDTSRCVVAVSWPKGIPPHMVATCSAEVHKVCRANMLHKLVQREDNERGKKHLADRLLRLARTALGFNATRVPNTSGAFNPALLQSDEEEGEGEEEEGEAEEEEEEDDEEEDEEED